MKNVKLILPFIIFSSILMLLTVGYFASCNTSYDDMLSSYNDNFERVVPVASLPNVNKEGFDQAAIIPLLSYEAGFDTILEINAAEGGVSYKWEVYIDNDTEEGIPVNLGKTDVSKSRISISITDFIFEAGLPYIIKVTVVNEAGTQMTDSAKLTIRQKVGK